jgi:hypothetical protein
MEFNVYYFKREDEKTQNLKKFKLCIFPSLRLSV